MRADDFNDAYPQGDEGWRSADENRVKELQGQLREKKSVWFYVGLCGLFGVMKLADATNEQFVEAAIFIGAYLAFHEIGLIRTSLIEIKIENERLKGAIRDTRWVSLYVQDRILERIDEAAPRRNTY